jgi:2-oxoglutarate ferredoxin oxidoreductase subunit delta
VIYIDEGRCNGCGMCVSFCPVNAISMQKDKAFIDEALCEGCEACLSVCPLSAILYVEVVDPLEQADAISVPEPVQADVLSVCPEQTSPSLAKRVLPLIGSALLWAGREVVPRLTSLALDMLDRRITSSDRVSPDRHIQPSEQITSMPAGGGGGRRRRQRNRANR